MESVRVCAQAINTSVGGVPIEVPLSNNVTVNQTLYTVQHTLNGTSFVNSDSYYVTVEARDTAGSTNVTANRTTVCPSAPVRARPCIGVARDPASQTAPNVNFVCHELGPH